ncbi:hypothetical protein ACFLUV_06750 [Elusimicrobiota bacterium]
MAVFEAYVPNVEVNGQTVLAVVNGMQAKDYALKILSENDIVDPQPEEWYLQQNWLNAFKALSEQIGPYALNAIGKSIPDSAKWPPQIDSIESALASIDVAYHMNHRIDGETLFNPLTGEMKEGIGHYEFKKMEDRLIHVICANPYPCAFDEGIIYQTAFKFKPADMKQVYVKHLDKKDYCRETGYKLCTYSVTWYDRN